MALRLDEELDRLDAALLRAERQGKAAMGAISSLRKLAAKGVVAGLGRRLQELAELAAPLAEAVEAAGTAFGYDAEAAFADGSYLAELREEARRRDLVLVERDGRITAFPLLLKFEPGVPALRVGRRLERQIRPGVLAGLLRQAQQSSTFDALGFLHMVYRAATALAGGDALRPGAVVPLVEIYDLLTLRPGAAAEYPREAFAVDLLRLNRAPDTRTREGHRFRLTASTGSKGRSRLIVYDEDGAEHAYVGIGFQRGSA